MEGSYDHRSHQQVIDLSLKVDSFNRQLKFKDVLVRDEDMSLCYKSGNMTDYHEKVLKRRDLLQLASADNESDANERKTTLTPTNGSFPLYPMEVAAKNYCLFVKLDSLKFRVTPNKKHWLRLCVYTVDP